MGKKKKVGDGFVARPLSESKHGAGGRSICGLSLVEQGRANGLERLDSKVRVVEVRQRWLSGVCLNSTNTHTRLSGLRSLRFKSRLFKKQVETTNASLHVGGNKKAFSELI